jgi:hypothetical protein
LIDYKLKIDRPKCRRCKGPLDIWHDPESGIGWHCNNPHGRHEPIMTDEEFTKRWNSLTDDEIAKLMASV